MGKFRSKLKGQTKGKRWPKGQSSSSNPETRKYRDQAKSKFFTQNIVNSNLTSEALYRHNAMQSYAPTVEKQEPTEMESEIDDSSTLSSYKTMQSFASEWSECSNMSFNRFLKVFRSDSALHKEMLAILAAITEVIKENGGTETPTEYFGSLLTTLEQIYNADVRNEDQLTAVLSLLSMGIKTVPEGVLRASFSDVTKKMLHILNEYINTDNNTIIKSILSILAALLCAQEAIVWNNSSTVQIFQCILNPFSIHTKPKWRKASHYAILNVIKADYFENKSINPAADLVAQFCEETLEKSMSESVGQTTILHILGLMKETICFYSKTHIKKCGEIILRLMTLNYPLVTSCSLQVLHSLFSAQTCTVPPKLNAQLISALYEYQPSVLDVQPTLAWLAVMQQAHIHLSDVDVSLCATVLPKIFGIVTQLWLSEKVEVVSGATHALELILRDAITPICQNEELVAQNRSKLEKCFNAIQLGLGFQYNTVWNQVLHTIGVMFEVAGRNCSDLLLDTLKSLAELRDSYKFCYNNELEHAVGAAIRTMGPEIVLNTIPIKKENGDLNIDRSWLLPVLKDNIKQSTIRYFVNGILPLALFCQRKSTLQAQQNDGIGSHSSELFYLQFWNLLPCFCTSPTDIKENFKTIAKVLGVAIADKKELRLAVMASLRKLISYAKENNPEDLNELSRFDKNYLPILFNLYTTKPLGSDEEGQRLAALDTIKMYLSIAKPELHQQLFSHAIERLNSSSDDPEDQFIKESILDLLRALVPYQNSENIQLLYEQCIKSLPEMKNNKEQKKAYRLLEEICGNNTEEGCLAFIKNNRKDVQKLLMKSLNTAAVASKGARLRCLNYLVKAQQSNLGHDSRLIRNIIPEAILCCKDINVKCRCIAYEVLNTIGETLMQHNQMQEFVELILAGFTGTPQLISCTILGLASILHNFSGALGQNNIGLILENVATLTKSSTREIVASCLSFLKVYCTSLPSPMVAASLPTIMKALTGMTEDCKRHFRLKTRDILDRLVRKYGCESITPHIPTTDTVMYKRLRNLRKLNHRKKKKREEMKEIQDEDEDFVVKTKPKSVEDILADSDSDLDGMEVDEPKNKNKTKTWIEENEDTIVDFTDPNVSRRITATKPGQKLPQPQNNVNKKEKDRGFKTAADGRLIITENDSSDDENKKKHIENDSDSDEDAGSIAETLLLTDRKRKRSTSGSVKSGFSSSSQPPMKYKTGGVGIHRPTQPGTEFKSRKAAGDVKRKGKHDPYAYLPLKRSALNRRKRMKIGTQFKQIVKAARNGALKGAKAKKNKK